MPSPGQRRLLARLDKPKGHCLAGLWTGHMGVSAEKLGVLGIVDMRGCILSRGSIDRLHLCSVLILAPQCRGRQGNVLVLLRASAGMPGPVTPKRLSDTA